MRAPRATAHAARVATLGNPLRSATFSAPIAMVITRLQRVLPWVALALSAAVAIAAYFTRTPAESYDQCLARLSHPDQTDDERREHALRCEGKPRQHLPVVGARAEPAK